jgi:hypothetical protein
MFSILRIILNIASINLFLGAAAAAEAKNLDQWLRQIKAIRQLPGQPFKVNKFFVNVLHRFAAGTDHMVMRCEIAVNPQSIRMRTDLPQQPALDEKPQIVVDRGQRDGWNAAPHRPVNVLRRIMPMGSDDSLINYLALVRNRKAVLRGQLAELFMGETHDYWIRISIK